MSEGSSYRRSTKLRRSALAGSQEYQPFEIKSLGGGLDRTVRRSLTDPGKWWDSEGLAAEELRAIKAGGYEALLEDRLAPVFAGEFSRGTIFYLAGTEAYWELYGFDPESMLWGTSDWTDWEFKLVGDPESSWTRILDVQIVGGAPTTMRWLQLFGSYPNREFGNVASYVVAESSERRRPMFRNVYGRLGSVGGVGYDTSQVNLIETLYEGPDDEHLILGSPRIVYKYDQASGRADYSDHINPIYATGNITTIGAGLAGATSKVTGAATGWDGSTWPLPVQERWLFKLDEDDDSYWTEVNSRTSATILELKYNYPKAVAAVSKAYKLIRVWQNLVAPEDARLSRWQSAPWGYDVPGRRIIMTNGVDPVLEFDAGSGRLTALSFWLDDIHTVPWAPAPSWARFVMEFKEHLILGYYKLGASVYERGFMWSDALDCTVWQQAYFRLLPGAGEMTGLGQLGDYLIVFLDRAVYSCRYLGAPFYFGIAQRIMDVGCVAAGSIQNIRDQQVVFMGEDNLYSYDGVRAVPIGDPVKDLIYPMLNDKNKPLISSLYDEVSGRYFLGVPTTDAGDRNQWTFVFDVNEQKWSRPYVGGFTAFGRHQITDDTGVVDDDYRIVDSVSDIVDVRYTEKTPVLLAGDHGGCVYKLTGSVNDDGSSKLASLETPTTDLGAPGVKRLGWVEVDIAKATGSVRLWVGLSSNGEEITWTGPYDVQTENTGGSGSPWEERKPRTWINKSARFFAFKFEHDAPDEDFYLDAMTVWFRWRGQR